MMKSLFRRYLSGEINENYLLEHLKFDTLDHLHRLLLEMLEVNEEGLRKVLLFWFDTLEPIQEDKDDNYNIAGFYNYNVRDIKSLQDTGSLFDYKTFELIEVLLNFKVMEKLFEKLNEIGKDYSDNSDYTHEDFIHYTVEQGYVIGLSLHEFGLRSIKEIDGLQFLKKLKGLNLAINEIEKIEGLEALVELEDLILGDGHYMVGNQISKIEGLDTLTKLTYLDLSFNNIKKIEGLEHLENLEYLNLAHNQITEIEGLGSLKKLKEIDLEENPVDDTKWEVNLYEGRK